MAVSTFAQSPRGEKIATKMPKKMQKSTKKVFLVAQELKLARILAGNNKTSRDRALKSLKKWFKHRSATVPFTEDDFMRIWKGLFYSMWMADKPLVQEECAENISSLVHFLPFPSSLVFWKCGFQTLINEWSGIDQLRMNKFLMFVRRLFRQGLVVVKYAKWQNAKVGNFLEKLQETVLNDSAIKQSMSLFMHFSEIYLEEIAKITEGKLGKDQLKIFLLPFIRVLSKSDDVRILNSIKKFVFIDLIRQTNLGLDYQEKYEAWKRAGFPGSINAMQKIDLIEDEHDDEHDDEDEKILDPRAGRVNVDLPQLKFCAKSLAEAFLNEKFADGTNAKSRKILTDLADLYNKLANGTYPLGIKKLNLPKQQCDTNIRKAAKRLIKFEKKLMGPETRKKRKSKEIAESGKKRKIEKIVKKPIESIFRRNSGTWFVTSKNDDDKEGKLESIPERERTIGLFEKTNEWDVPPTEGDCEYFVPAKKFTRSQRKNESITRLRVQKRLDSQLPKRKKKVKINTKLNQSQDVSEHHQQILSSPAIPYDSNRKPMKPLLKNSLGSPVNPFFPL